MHQNEATVRFIEVYNWVINNTEIKKAAEFARKIGISTSLLNEIVKGRSNAGVECIQNTVQILNVSPHWLLSNNGSMFENENIVNEPRTKYLTTKPDNMIEKLHLLENTIKDKEEIISFLREKVRTLEAMHHQPNTGTN